MADAATDVPMMCIVTFKFSNRGRARDVGDNDGGGTTAQRGHKKPLHIIFLSNFLCPPTSVKYEGGINKSKHCYTTRSRP